VGFRFRRSISLLPGIRVNLGKRGASVSLGRRGAHVTIGPTGTRTTVGLPGTGLSYTHLERPATQASVEPVEEGETAERASNPVWRLLVLLFLCGVLYLLFAN
jgi:hypothetical protein